MNERNRTLAGREPSFTAMAHAWGRHAHATRHASPIFSDTRSMRLVPAEIRERIASLVNEWSPEAVDAYLLMAVVRHRLLADRLPAAHQRGVRQLVILGAGLDTTAFALPEWGRQWRVFEVDHPATQEWKRERIAQIGWQLPANLTFAPCDFEEQGLLTALDAAGFARQLPALTSVLGVIIYLTAAGTRTTLAELAALASGSEVTLTYSAPLDGTDPVVQEVFDRGSPVADEAGEGYVGYYKASEMEAWCARPGSATASTTRSKSSTQATWRGGPTGCDSGHLSSYSPQRAESRRTRVVTYAA